jgi:thiazole synthase
MSSRALLGNLQIPQSVSDLRPRRAAQAYNYFMEPLVIAGKAFQSRLIVGTGKYKDGPETQAAIEASGAEMVTVAVRRLNLDRTRESLLDYIDPERYFLLPNTAGCYTADEAIRAARLGREVGLSDWVKIEVIGDQATLYPDVQATLEATRVLVKEGFTVLPYTSDDIVFARRLIDAGAAAVMPLGAPIGSGMGLQNLATLRILREMITEVPLIVDGHGGGCGADQLRHRARSQAGADGRGDAACGARRTAVVPLRPNAEEAIRDCQLAARGPFQVTFLHPHDYYSVHCSGIDSVTCASLASIAVPIAPGMESWTCNTGRVKHA